MHNMAKFLYTHNPFYLVSAGLVLYGLHLTFESRDASGFHAYYLMASLSAYTVLLALTAWAVVRFGKVWDDARTLALLVVLMFVAISSSFDEVCFQRPKTGFLVMTVGWILATITSESLLRALPVKLPWQFRLPYFAGLALFFAFPALMMSDWAVQSGWPIEARVGLFPIVAAVITLFLIGAASRGPRLLASNGSPWPWPWYPWSIFLFLAIGVCIRSYILTISFQSDVGWTTTFGPHYLIPFALAVLIVLAEMSFSHPMPRLRKFVIAAPALLLVAAVRLNANASYKSIFDEFTYKYGSPLWLTLCSLIFFYCYQWIRGERRSEWPMMALLAIGSTISVDTTTLTNTRIQSIGWLYAIALVQLITLVRDRRSVRLLLTGCCVASIAMSLQGSHSTKSMELLMPIHMVVASVGLCGVFLDDAFAKFVRIWSPLAVVGIVLVACLNGHSPGCAIPVWNIYYYAIAWTFIAFVVWFFQRDRAWTVACATCAGILGCSSSVQLFKWVELRISIEAMAAMLLGALCFVVGALVSAIKGGYRLPFIEEWRLARAKVQVEPELIPVVEPGTEENSS